MADRVDFISGLVLGVLLGGTGVYAMVKIRGWFTSSEVRRLRQENRQMERRLAQKDRHVEEMLQRAEDMAREMQRGRTKGDES